MNDPHIWWYVTRASAIVAWGLMTVSVLWGVLLSTRALRPIDNPAWLQDLHRWLGGASLIMIALHMVSLMLDAWSRFSVTDVLVPFSASYRPGPVALGILAFYLLATVQGSSLLIHRLPRRFWKGLHYASYAAVLLVSFHAGWAGSDVGAWGYRLIAILLVVIVTVAAVIRIVVPKKPSSTAGAARTAPAVREDETNRQPMTVTGVRPVAAHVISFELAPVDGGSLPLWSPGSNITLHLPSGLQRQYSLCGDPADRRHYTIAVQLAAHSRGGSEWLHTYAAPGLVLEVSGPQNHFRLEPARDYLFIAGGIGITPIKAMIESLPADRQWRLIYAGRSRSAMAFLGEVLERWPSRVTVSVRDEAEGRVDLSRVLAESDAEVYCCGPESLMNDVAARVPADRLHLERFVPMTRPAGGPRLPVEVTCSRSGNEVHVSEDESLLDALEKASVPVYGSCREGVCGACETRVIDGRPEHFDSVMSDQDKDDLGIMYPCVSRARGRTLVLDV